MSGRSWKFESSHGHEKQKSANSRFFLLYHYPFRVLFSTYYTKLTLVVVKKTRQHKQQRQHFYLIPKSYCPRLSLVVVKKYTTTKTTFLSYSQKLLSKVVPRCRQKIRQHKQQRQHFYLIPKSYCPRLSLVVVKKTRQHRQQRQHFFLIPKMLSKVVLRCRQKNHLFMKIFIFVSENIKMFCLGNISLSLKSTIRFFQKESHLFNVLRNEMVD